MIIAKDCDTWDPVFKTAASAPDAAMILRLFSPKKIKINIDRKLYWGLQGEQDRVENSSCKPQKAK
jgi:hypothetical protein